MQFKVTKLYLLMVVTLIFTACTSDDIEESSATEATEVKATEIIQSKMVVIEESDTQATYTGNDDEEDKGKD